MTFAFVNLSVVRLDLVRNVILIVSRLQVEWFANSKAIKYSCDLKLNLFLNFLRRSFIFLFSPWDISKSLTLSWAGSCNKRISVCIQTESTCTNPLGTWLNWNIRKNTTLSTWVLRMTNLNRDKSFSNKSFSIYTKGIFYLPMTVKIH